MGAFAKILQYFAPIAVERIKSDIETVSVTGKSAKTVRAEVTQSPTVDRLTIFGPTYIETGRGPRRSTAESDFQDNLVEWIKKKKPGLSDKKQQQLARFFRLRINKSGDETFKKGGRKVYHDTVVKVTSEIKAEAVKDFRIKFSRFVKNSFHGTNYS